MLRELLHELMITIREALGIKEKDFSHSLEKNFQTRASRMSDHTLANTILHYQTEYFEFIGEHHTEVAEFKTAIADENIALIAVRWEFFRFRFMKYEQEAGHRGRPLIMDYYFTYEFYLREYQKRNGNSEP